MEDFNAKQSPEDVKKLMEQLRAENAALRDENAALRDENATLRDENATLHQTRLTLGQQLAAAEAERAQAQAELSTLTEAAQVLQDDREALRSKIAELQAAVDRLTNMLWGRRSERRVWDPNQTRLFPAEDEPEGITADDLAQDVIYEQLIKQWQPRATARETGVMGHGGVPDHF